MKCKPEVKPLKRVLKFYTVDGVADKEVLDHLQWADSLYFDSDLCITETTDVWCVIGVIQ